jgi:D-lactate dehydrogenase (quinone)
VVLVRWARRHRVPLVARGAGTSLDGESTPVRGGVVVDLSGMDHVLEVNEKDRWARVGPGVVNYRLQEILRPHGFFFPPNPGSWERSTIGGNASTNASGFRSFRYGATRAWVLGARAVLGTGEAVALGARTWKRSAGPDLLHAMLGGEGTLGIFTELTVRLAPLPPGRMGLLAGVGPKVSLGRVAQGLQGAQRDGLSAVEWVDARVAGALLRSGRLPLSPRQGALLLEIETSERSRPAALKTEWARRLRAVGVPGPVHLFPDADELWRERGRAGSLLDEGIGPRIREDVGVPLSRWDELLRRVRALARRHRVELVLYAHLGEGSLHPNFLVDPGSPQAARLQRELWQIAWALEGTASAEHGLGWQKAGAYRREHGLIAARAMLALKRAVDPDGILNPGKMFG